MAKRSTGLRSILGIIVFLPSVGCMSTDPPARPPHLIKVPVPQDGEVVFHDEQGRLQYIVDLVEGASNGFPKTAHEDTRFPPYELPEAQNLVHSFESEYAVQATSMTSLVGLSFSAFMTDEQVHAIAKDQRVSLISLNVQLDFSSDATAVWSDIDVSGEFLSWGKLAINNSQQSSNGSVTVYVMDSGIAPHEDLAVSRWVSATDYSIKATPDTLLTYEFRNRLVGCYPHSTHVAGIIGARSNGKGVQGVFPGVDIVSVAVSTASGTAQGCLDRAPTIESLKSGFEWVKSDLVSPENKNKDRAGIVNLSMVMKQYFSHEKTLGKSLTVLAKNIPGYPGAFVAQSAGNQYESASMYAYDAPSSDDGIMVVGAINNHGQPVVPLNGVNGFHNGSFAESERGSNFGSAVEIWAPGAKIRSTWADNPQVASVVSSKYEYLSGTSMAAPHIAGLAAYLAEAHNLKTPQEIEHKIHGLMFSLMSRHPTDQVEILTASINSMPNGTYQSTPYAEIALSKQPFMESNPPEYPSQSGVTSNDAIVFYEGDTITPFTLRLGSIGQSGTYSCDVRRSPFSNPNAPEIIGSGETFFAKNVEWGLGSWVVDSSTCPSARATIITGQPLPRGHWFVNGIEKTMAHTFDVASSAIVVPAMSTPVFSYTSENAELCAIAVNYNTDPNSINNSKLISLLSPLAQSGIVDIGANGTLFGYYRYQLVCKDAYGTAQNSYLYVMRAEPTQNDAGFVTQIVPSFVTAGKPFLVKLGFQNTGSEVWTPAGNYRLGSQNPQDNSTWGTSRQQLAPGDMIGYQQQKWFEFNAVAPSVPGNYMFQWRMLKEGVEWFGEFSPAIQIAVTPPATKPKSGAWYNPARPGWGLHVSRNTNDEILVHWETYTNQGLPIWYQAQLTEQGGRFEGTLYSYEWSNNTATSMSHGTMTLITTSETTGTISWVLDEIPGSEPVQYLLFDVTGAAPNITGAWYAPSQPGWGMFLDMQGDTLVPAVAIYDSSGQAIWLTYNGGSWDGSTFNVDLAQTSGVNLCPACAGMSSYSGVNVGTMQIKNISGGLDAATLDMTFSGALSQWNRSNIPIARLTF